MFQSLLPFTQTGHSAHRMMALRIENTHECRHDAYLAQDTQWHSFICSMFRHLIASERLVWSKHFVFYRTVNEKYVLYQFNTLLLSLLGHARPADGLIGVPSLDTSRYFPTMQALMSIFHYEGMNDVRVEGDVLLSVNNCLCPTDVNSIRMHKPLRHSLEVEPLFYYMGYDGAMGYFKNMCKSAQHFLGASPEEAYTLIKAVFALYEDSQPTGHCLQICIPKEVLEDFVYTSLAYGIPVALHLDQDRLHVVPYHAALPSHQPITLTHFLSSRPELCKLQSRILVHPDLFLRHGAFTKVFHGSPFFYPVALRKGLLHLAPVGPGGPDPDFPVGW